MKKLFSLFALVAAFAAAPSSASAQQVLTGDTRLACEAILCLAASGTRPQECTPSLTRFFSINHKRLSDTLRARENFLRMCPTSSNPYAEQVIAAALGQDVCSANNLNQNYQATPMESGYYIPDPQLPPQCVSYYNNPSISATMKPPVFIGIPGCGGAWQNGNEAAMRTKEWESKVYSWKMQGGAFSEQCSIQIGALPLGNPGRVQQGFDQFRAAPLGAPAGWEFRQ